METINPEKEPTTSAGAGRARGWGGDRAPDSPDLLPYLDTFRATDFAAEYKLSSFELLNIQPGDRVLDAGCGPGDDARVMAGRFDRAACVLGVDYDPHMVAEARQRAALEESPGPQPALAFLQADLHALPFRDASFDCCRADRVFQHLLSPHLALEELVRVLKPGGRVVVTEPDWGALLIDAADRVVTRKILNFLCDRVIRNGWIGRQLPNLFREYNLTDIRVVTHTYTLFDFEQADRLWVLRRGARWARDVGAISDRELNSWLGELEAASRSHRFFGAFTGFGVFGAKAHTSPRGTSRAEGRGGREV